VDGGFKGECAIFYFEVRARRRRRADARLPRCPRPKGLAAARVTP
jgi:hypothetical protein